MQYLTYEVTFAGQAGEALRTEFDDCEVTVGRGTTTIRADLPDPAALAGLVLRVTSLRLQVIHLHLVAPAPEELLARQFSNSRRAEYEWRIPA